MKDEDLSAVPTKFWATVTLEEFSEIAATGHLNAEQCKRLWRMEDRQTEPPQRLEVLIKRSEFEKLLKKKPK